MRTIYNFILLLLVGVIVLPSCNDDFLTENPKSSLAPENTFVNTTGFETALTGLYDQVRDEWGWYGGGLMYAPMFAGTDLSVSGTRHGHYTPFEDYADAINSSTTIVKAYWNWAYKTIGNANLIIEAAENENVEWDNASDKTRVLGEARFLRAYAYRDLITLYGDVPLVKEVEKPFRLDYTRQSVSEILDFMIEDLKFASDNLPDLAEDEGKVVKAAAQHMLAETYLHANKPELAEQAAKAVINSGTYKLMKERFGKHTDKPGDVFADMFLENNQNRSSGNQETIWAIQQQYNVDGGGGSRYSDWSRRCWVPYYSKIQGMQLCDSLGGRGLGRQRPLQWWIDAYEAQDMRASKYNIRREYWYNDPTHEKFGQKVEMTEERINNGELFPSTTKFNFGVTDDSPSYISNLKDRVKIRLAETYLLLAEAQLKQNRPGDAAISINEVRARANATPVAEADVDMDYILDERARELFGEYPRRFTLIRTGKLLERVRSLNPVSKTTIRDYHVLWPIPQTAIDANSGAILEQNDGYK
uniref:RagB/SusD family nutrient uptake outer membrane protein n=1 Tax=uncultured Draconibacterium sp. TaxID=1573823 RepID=UPI0032166BD9